ncbi:MAG: hypothetical protein ACRD2T_04600, partial [Thermoanaerobaculia bacterium]
MATLTFLWKVVAVDSAGGASCTMTLRWCGGPIEPKGGIPAPVLRGIDPGPTSLLELLTRNDQEVVLVR